MPNYFNPYLQGNYITELQNMRDRIDNQIQQVQSQQMPQPITQNFQLAPSVNNFRLVNSLEDVQKELVVTDTYFLSKDYSNMWLKTTKGEIRTFTVNEVIPKDERDLLIEDLQKQIKELKGGESNELKSDGKQFTKQPIRTDGETTTTE